MATSNGKRLALKDIVANQLPEFVRAEYPTFVAFVEAYYEFLDSEGVDLSSVRDIDTTLEDYIKFFKAELAHNYPVVSTDSNTERFLLKHIKEQYLAKGSEASYKLLFRLLYGKDVFIDYPGRQMLRVSDGRWTQDVSIFVQVAQGNPVDLVGKTVSIQTGKKIYNMDVVSGVDSFSGVVASIQSAVAVDESLGIWELFLDRNFYGEISPNNTVKYGSEFQATILPATAKIKISDPGKNFRPGMVFQLNTGEGTPFWFKVATVNDNGGLKTIDVIKFGLFYNTSFSVTVLPSSAVTTKKKRSLAVSDLTYTVSSNGKIVEYKILTPGANYQQPPLIEITGDGTGAAAHAIIENGSVTEIVIDSLGEGYTEVYAHFTNAPGDITGAGANLKPVIGSDYDYNFKDKTDGFTESGYVNLGDYWDSSEHGRGASIIADAPVDGVIHSFAMNSQGQDYTTATVTINDATGSGTVAEAVIENGGVVAINVTTFGSGYTNPTITIDGDGTGASADAILIDGCITNVTIVNGGSGYDLATPLIDINYPQSNGENIPYSTRAVIKIDSIVDGVITSCKVTNPGEGYTTTPLVKVVGSYGYANGGYVGTIARQFFINAADTQGDNPAILNVVLDAVSKYPGYYKTNDGFLDDSMMIQDSYYFQAFAYVLKIDEQLNKYASVVRSMLHPSGMAMFGEYSINNQIPLSIGLTSLVKSLGVTLYDTIIASDAYEVDSNGNVIRGSIFSMYKTLETTYDGTANLTEKTTHLTSKLFGKSIPWPTEEDITNGYITAVQVDTFFNAGLNRYLVTVAGNITATQPTHTSGTATNGTATLQYIGTEQSSLASSAQYLDYVSKLWVANTAVALRQVIYYNNRKYVVRTAGTTSNVPPTSNLGTQFNGSAILEYIGTDVVINTSNQTATRTQYVGDPYQRVVMAEVFNKVFTKGIGLTGQTESVFMLEAATKYFTKSLADSATMVQTFAKLLTTKSFVDFAPMTDLHAIDFTLNTIDDPTSGVYPEEGFVVLDPYEHGSYQLEWYSNERPSTFSS